MPPIDRKALAPLIDRYGERWKVWHSAQGQYACATVRRGLSWVRPQDRHPVGARGAYVQTLVTESPGELAAAIEQADGEIGRLLATGALRKDP